MAVGRARNGRRPRGSGAARGEALAGGQAGKLAMGGQRRCSQVKPTVNRQDRRLPQHAAGVSQGGRGSGEAQLALEESPGKAESPHSPARCAASSLG